MQHNVEGENMKRIPKDVVATFSIVAFDPATGSSASLFSQHF